MKVGITYKLSKLEWDMLGFGFTRDEAIEFYKKQRQDVDKILASHERQKNNINAIIKEVPGAEVVDLIGIEKAAKPVPPLDLIILMGGDNFFQKCAFYFPDAYLVGVNSDPETSHGALLYFNSESLLEKVGYIVKGDFETEYWTKLATTLNGKRIKDTTCTSSLSIKATDMISRYLLKLNHEQEEQKATGILVVTGAGSGKGAWYRNSGLYLPQIKSGLYPQVAQGFPKTSKELRTLTREPMGGEDCKYKWLNHSVREGEELQLIYWTHYPSELSIDSVERHEVNEGDYLVFKASKNMLKVVKP